MLIASGFLLGGVLLAQRYPADREDEPAATQTVVARRNETPASPPTPLPTSQEPASMASRIDEGDRYEHIRDFVNGPESRELPRMSMAEPSPAIDADQTPRVEETPEPDRGHYADIPMNRTIAKSAPAEQENVRRLEYQPFQMTTPITMPEPNPVFLAETPSPLNLIGLPLLSSESERGERDSAIPSAVNPSAAVPSAIVAPSAVLQPGEISNRVTPASTATSVTTPTPTRATLARPDVPVSGTLESATHHVIPTVVSPAREPRSTVFVAPAKTIILPPNR